MQITVELRREGEPPRQFTLGPGVTMIGRAPDNDIVLHDVGVSRRHARLVVRQTGAVLEDLGSGNGSFIRGERIRRHAVADGDEVVIDPYVLTFRVPVGRPAGVGEEETALVDPAQGLQEAGPRHAWLVVLHGHGLAERYALDARGIRMGRSGESDIVLMDPAASRLQAELRLKDDVFWIHDFGSANGTFVNGRRVRERPLQHGDRIRIGSTEFRFELEDIASLAPATDGAPPGRAAAPAATVVRAVDAGAPPSPPASNPGAAGTQDAPSPPPAPARGPTAGLGMVVGALLATVLLIAGVAALGIGYVGWRAWTSRPATIAAEAAIADAEGTDAEPRGAGGTDAPGDSTKAVEADGVQALMDRGMQLFREESYLEATALFYKALKRDPTNLEAERMCYIACEFLAIQQLRADLRQRELTPEQRQEIYQQAVILARRAMRGAADLDEAERAILAALEWYPEDDNLLDLQRSVQARRARSTRAGRHGQASSASMPSGNARLARRYLDEGLQAIGDGRYVTARDRLSRALQMDPTMEEARARLAEVDDILYERAETAWAQARQLEAQGDTEGALAAYQQVVSYAGVSQAQLKRDAQQRIAALGG